MDGNFKCFIVKSWIFLEHFCHFQNVLQLNYGHIRDCLKYGHVIDCLKYGHVIDCLNYGHVIDCLKYGHVMPRWAGLLPRRAI